MATCFICNDKLLKERIRMFSSVTQYSKISYSEKIVDLMGEEFVVIATSSDHMCRKCVLLLNHMDKLENDLKLIKDTLLSFIHKKYGLLPTVPSADSMDVVNDRLILDEELQDDQSIVSIISNPAVINKSIHVVNDQLRPNGKLQVDQNKVSSGNKMDKMNQVSTTSLKIKSNESITTVYRCSICPYQSNEIRFVRTHIVFHKNESTNKKYIQIVTNPIRNLLSDNALFKCDMCASFFGTQSTFLSHIHKSNRGVPRCLFNKMVKENKVSPTIKPAKTLMITEGNCNKLLGDEDGGQEFNKNGENASGHGQKTVNIDIQSFLAAMQGK